jgi:hypothetical protein
MYTFIKKWGYGLCLSLFLISQVLANEPISKKIVVLGSIKNENFVLPWKKAERIIKKKFSRGLGHLPYEVIIISDATQVDLNYYLMSSDTIALFWVGHSAAESVLPDLAGLRENGLILDSKKRNVGNVFQRISPQIKLISVVGCSSIKLLEAFSAKGSYANNPKLTLQGFDRPMEMSQAIELAIKKALPVLENFDLENEQNIEQFDREEVVRILFTRNADTVIHDSLQLSVNGHFVKVLPSNFPGMLQEEVVEVPQKWLLTGTVNKILLSSGYNLISKRHKDNGIFNLGLLEKSGELTRFSQKGVDVEKVNVTLFYYRP